MIERQHMTIRAQELARTSGGRITAVAIADKLAAEFDHATDDIKRDFFIKLVSSSIIEPDLPAEDTHGQLALPMPLTGFLRVRDAQGALEFVEADIATGEEAVSALTAKKDRHSTHAKRATKKLKEVRAVMEWAGYDKARAYNDNCHRYRKALENKR